MPTQPPPDRKTRVILALVVSAIALAMMGNFFWPILKDIYRARQNGGHGSNVPLLIFGGFFLVMVLVTVISVALGIRRMSNPKSAMTPPRDTKPWLARPDWAAGKIKSSAGAQTKIFAFMALMFCGIGAMYTFAALPKELHNGNYKALIVLIFPAIGIGFVIAIIRGMMARRRFGECFFEPAQIPAPLGGTLEGLIQTGARLKLEQGLHLKISCVHRTVTVTGSGKNRNTNVNETVLWQDEKVFKPEADLPEPEPGHSGIPVFFKLPGDQPECFARGNESVFWRLDAKSKMRGPDFSVAFDVPVFKVAGAIAEAADEADPTAALQEPVEELRRDEHSRIRVTDDPDGREFYFPAARNLGTAFGLTLFFLAWTGFTLAAYFLFKSLFFEIIFTAVDVLIFFGCLNLWLKSSRVTIDSTGVRETRRWLLFSRSRNFAANDIVRFDVKAGMTSGTQTFQNIKLITKDSENRFAANREKFQQNGQKPPLEFQVSSPGGYTLASGIASTPEANWLVQEMTGALGRKL